MKKIITAAIVLLIAIVIGYLIQRDPGDIIATYNGWQIETSLWLAIAAIIIVFLLIHWLIRLFRHTKKIPQRYRNWGQSRTAQKARELTHLGLCELAEGHWSQAQAYLLEGASLSSTPLINYLGAAQAAQKLGQYKERDRCLQQAHQKNPQAQIAIVLTQAQLQIDSEQWEQALATLKHLNQIAPHHHYAIKLLTTVHLALKDWQQLHELLPQLKKLHSFTRDEFVELQKNIYLNWLQSSIDQHNQNVNEVWQLTPKALRQELIFIETFTDYLVKTKQDQLAADMLSKALKKTWSSKLILNFGTLNIDINTQLYQAERWLTHHPQDPDLLYVLGSLSLRANLLGKAQKYLQTSYQLKPKRHTLQLLGELHEHLNQADQACKYYREALDFS